MHWAGPLKIGWESANSSLMIFAMNYKNAIAKYSQCRLYDLTLWSSNETFVSKTDGDKLLVPAGTPRNGMSSYASYLLGLEVEDEASRPVLSFRPTADGTAFELDFPAIAPRDERSTGVMIGYELVSAADARMTEDRQIAPLVAEPHFTVTRDERASRFYRVRIRFVGW